MGGCVVTIDCSGGLRMTHFNQGCVDGNGLLAIEEDRTGFSLGGGCHNGAYGLALGEDRSVWNSSSPDVSFWDSNLSRYGHGEKTYRRKYFPRAQNPPTWVSSTKKKPST